MSKASRRDFLKASTLAVGASAFGSFAAPRMVFSQTAAPVGKDTPTLICVYLRGGADSLNTIIPYTDPMYYEMRPTIAIAPKDNGDEKGVLKLDNQFGLHPGLEALMPLYEKGFVAPILNVGSPNETRSHFDAQDLMERGNPFNKQVVQGWLNRYLELTKNLNASELRALSFQPLLPRSLRGSYPVLAVPDGDAHRMLDTFEDLYTCEQKEMIKKQEELVKQGKAPKNVNIRQPITSEDAYRTIVNAGSNEIRRLRELREIVVGGRNGDYPRSHFGRQMSDIATVIKADRGLEVAAIDYEGWDHHAYQGGAEGTQARMYKDVSSVMAAFFNDVGEDRMKKCLVLLMSEFGRTARENGTNGTDHGRGGFMLAMGGNVNGKKVYGKWTGLAPENLADKRDMPVTTDFRQVMAESLECLFNFDTMKAKAFPDFKPTAPMNFMKHVAKA